MRSTTSGRPSASMSATAIEAPAFSQGNQSGTGVKGVCIGNRSLGGGGGIPPQNPAAGQRPRGIRRPAGRRSCCRSGPGGGGNGSSPSCAIRCAIAGRASTSCGSAVHWTVSISPRKTSGSVRAAARNRVVVGSGAGGSRPSRSAASPRPAAGRPAPGSSSTARPRGRCARATPARTSQDRRGGRRRPAAAPARAIMPTLRPRPADGFVQAHASPTGGEAGDDRLARRRRSGG